MSKYIIEIKPEYEDTTKGVMILGAKDSNLFVDTLAVENLEELNSDYINEHFSDLQDDAYNKGYAQCQDDYSDALKHAKDTAYKKGLHDGESKCVYCNEYQRGLDDAWEAAKKIVCDDELDWNTLLHIFNRGNFDGIFGDYSASEAIAKLKAYEEKRKADDEIKVGDEVIYNEHKFIVFATETEECYASLFDVNGRHASASQRECKKTGRHVGIIDMLKGALE